MTSLSAGGDGVAYVARLLERVCQDITGKPPALVTLEQGAASAVSLPDRIRFTAQLLASHALRRADWWLFNHVGIARAQRWLAPGLRRPYGIVLHGIEVWDQTLPRSRKQVLEGAKVLIANSHFTARRISAVHPELGRIRPCPLGLLPEPGDARRDPDAELLSRIAPASVLIVGRMDSAERYKGHDQLLACWPRVLERVPEAQLVVVGKGNDSPRLQAYAEQLGISASVLFTGFIPDATLHHLLRRVAVFAMPSRGEGFGLVYLEAMRAGLPCIGSTADAAQDVIVNGETGLLVDPMALDLLSSGVARLLTDAGLRRAWGEAGRQRYQREFTYERFRDRLVSILVDSFSESADQGAACVE